MTKVSSKKAATTAKAPVVTKAEGKVAKKTESTSSAASSGSYSKSKKVTIEACKSWYDI